MWTTHCICRFGFDKYDGIENIMFGYLKKNLGVRVQFKLWEARPVRSSQLQLRGTCAKPPTYFTPFCDNHCLPRLINSTRNCCTSLTTVNLHCIDSIDRRKNKSHLQVPWDMLNLDLFVVLRRVQQPGSYCNG